MNATDTAVPLLLAAQHTTAAAVVVVVVVVVAAAHEQTRDTTVAHHPPVDPDTRTGQTHDMTTHPWAHRRLKTIVMAAWVLLLCRTADHRLPFARPRCPPLRETPTIVRPCGRCSMPSIAIIVDNSARPNCRMLWSMATGASLIRKPCA